MQADRGFVGGKLRKYRSSLIVAWPWFGGDMIVRVAAGVCAEQSGLIAVLAQSRIGLLPTVALDMLVF